MFRLPFIINKLQRINTFRIFPRFNAQLLTSRVYDFVHNITDEHNRTMLDYNENLCDRRCLLMWNNNFNNLVLVIGDKTSLENIFNESHIIFSCSNNKQEAHTIINGKIINVFDKNNYTHIKLSSVDFDPWMEIAKVTCKINLKNTNNTYSFTTILVNNKH